MATPSLVNLFFSHIKSCRYVFPNGAEAAFINGQYATDDEGKIAHLNAEIAAGNIYIFTDPQRLQIDPKDLDPMEALKKKVIEQYLAEQAAQALTESASIPQALTPAGSNVLVDVPTAEQSAVNALSGIKLK